MSSTDGVSDAAGTRMSRGGRKKEGKGTAASVNCDVYLRAFSGVFVYGNCTESSDGLPSSTTSLMSSVEVSQLVNAGVAPPQLPLEDASEGEATLSVSVGRRLSIAALMEAAKPSNILGLQGGDGNCSRLARISSVSRPRRDLRLLERLRGPSFWPSTVSKQLGAESDESEEIWEAKVLLELESGTVLTFAASAATCNWCGDATFSARYGSDELVTGEGVKPRASLSGVGKRAKEAEDDPVWKKRCRGAD